MRADCSQMQFDLNESKRQSSRFISIHTMNLYTLPSHHANFAAHVPSIVSIITASELIPLSTSTSQPPPPHFQRHVSKSTIVPTAALTHGAMPHPIRIQCPS